MKKYHFITFNRDILGGKPIIKNTRISVDLILEWIASGASVEQIPVSYPQLSSEAVKEAILYATDHLRNEILIEAQVAS
jgi:uncharacterized protein (DUF433 family)